ncbi:hypothetical protein [Corynebacterium freiburgense]|uniref:hypothetical protein n=1 Tax=Corynebacterium freiburgense TaxID=556548 RepID=UPI0003F6517D|nr:hypothetical protein [Corynebacterium freiburgense]WJZ03232.1 hypothetical protein CFREI_09770 [Corynebacterium freiburgense]
MGNSDEQWFYNPSTGEVAQGKHQSWDNRMGPYASEAEAHDAMKIAAERTAAADAYDEEGEDWGVSPAWEK